jgi:hypothetical protein
MKEPTNRQVWSARSAFALVLILSALGILAAFSAFGSPASAASQEYEYGKKVTICHHTGSQRNPTVTISVSENAVPAHQAHGDTLGPCPS